MNINVLMELAFIGMLNVIISGNARMVVMKPIAHVMPLCILNVTISIAFHPGDNVMVSMTVMTCLMRIIVQVVLVNMNLDAKKAVNVSI